MKNRFSAFLIHLLLSGVVAGVAVILVFFVWYPMPLHSAVGVTEIFLILLSVDIVIGPMLTFVVYKPGKASLKFDLTVIALLQLMALGYGINTVFQGRPAFVVFSQDRFEIARASDIDAGSAQIALQNKNATAQTSWASPRWVAAVASPDPKRDQEILFSATAGGPDWPLLPELFVPLVQVKEQILKKARPLQELEQLSHKNQALNIKTQDFAALQDWQDKAVKWLPLRGKVKDMVVLVDANSAAVMKIIDINPWP
ncbi:TfpX/TfpZ family type IV pilin accessory protein [Crenothrix sp.]|uniref:TfpX/TfpZ family type IV pilin accessory protein n=1 Tax=Crenothrix sp. TaxID=3100433 RepID=UPI00374DABCA